MHTFLNIPEFIFTVGDKLNVVCDYKSEAPLYFLGNSA